MVRKSSLIIIGFFCLLICSALLASDTPPNYKISSPNDRIQYGEQILVSPIAAGTIVTTWRDYRFGDDLAIGRSIDGGVTWVESFVNSSMHIFGRLNNPQIASDNAGNIYISMLDFQPNNPSDSSHITILKSSDDGLTWAGPYTVYDTIGHYMEWKHSIAVDKTSGPSSGNIYVAFVRNSEFEGDGYYGPNSIIFAKSTDGTLSFDNPVVIGLPLDISFCSNITGDLLAAGDFPDITVGSDGAIYVFWNQYLVENVTGGCYLTEYYKKMVKSIDGGETWTEPRPIIKNDLAYHSIDGDIIINGTPIVVSDVSGGPYDGNLYMAYAGVYDSDIYGSDYNIEFIKSADGGETWSQPIYVNDDYVGDDAISDQFHPRMTCTENGAIVIVFYDQKTDPNHYKFDVFAAYSFDGGATFTKNHRISNTSIDPDKTLELGYPYHRLGNTIGVASRNGKVNAVWTDTRDGNQDVYTAAWEIPISEPKLLAPDVDERICGNPKFEWATSWYENDDQYLIEISEDPLFGTVTVSEITGEPSIEIPIEKITNRENFWRVKASKISSSESSEFSRTGAFYADKEPPPPAIPISPETGSIVYKPLVLEWYQIGQPDCPPFYDLEISTDESFNSDANVIRYTYLTETKLILTDFLHTGVTYYWHVLSKNSLGATLYYGMTASFELQPFICGDSYHDETNEINILDIVHLINFVYKDGPTIEPPECGDINSDLVLNILDIVGLINFIYKDGPTPECPQYSN